MTGDGRLKIGMYWASSCGGCDISLLEIGPDILELIRIADIVFWPCVADFKYSAVEALPPKYLNLCFFNGGIRNSEQEAIARLLRAKSKTLIAYGTCAAEGGIPALANFRTPREIFNAAYHENPSIDNPDGVEPRPEVETGVGTLEIPRFYRSVQRLQDVVSVDYLIPGCPPQADDVWETLEAIVSGAVPAHNGGIKLACSTRTVCDECTREKRLIKIKQFRRPHEFRPEPGWCLLEQGLLCMGSATRGGCGALCPKVNMRCEGCYGPPANADDQAATMIGAIGTLVDATTEEHGREIVEQIADSTASFYRFSLASSPMKVARAPQKGGTV